MCDGKHDCTKGEDEPVNCFINECLTHRGHCMHECQDLKIGFQCTCKPGKISDFVDLSDRLLVEFYTLLYGFFIPKLIL